MSASPQASYQQVFDRRTRLYENLIKNFYLNELEAAALERQLKKMTLTQSLPMAMKSAAHHELACVYSYSLKTKLALEHINISRRLGLEEYASLASECLFYNLAGDLSEARKKLENWNSSNNTPSIERSILSHAVQIGMFEIAQKIMPKDDSSHEYIEAAIDLLATKGIGSEKVTERLELAVKTVIEKTGKPFLAFNLFAMKGEGILYEIIVDGTTNELIAIDDVICERIIEKYGFDDLEEILSISVSPYVEGSAFPVNGGYSVTIT